MRLVLTGVFAAVLAAAGFMATDTHAVGLKVQPLSYKTTLKEGEQQKGFIDISNPSSIPVSVKISVQGFRQVNDDGGLEFYDDRQLSGAIRPELASLSLNGKDAIRLAFTVNGNTLPEGDVFAALFFTTEPTQPQNGVGQQVRVGTLLSIVNKTPGERRAVIDQLSVHFIQLSDTIKGEYEIRNVGARGKGFYPTVKITAWPGASSKDVESSLVFGGRKRSNEFSLDVGYGLHKIESSYGSSSKSRWVLTVAPWMIILALFTLVVIGAEIAVLRRKRKKTPETSS